MPSEPARHELTLKDRCVAAGGASVAAALIVNPLDVVKFQVTTTCGHSAWQLAGCQAACQRLATAPAVPTTLPAACAAHCYIYDSALDGLIKIVRQEGVHTLWTGTGMSLLMAVPSVGMLQGSTTTQSTYPQINSYLGIYLPLYDWLYAQSRDALPQAAAPYAPLAAGVLARTVTVVATTPLELLRTRIQAGQAGKVASLWGAWRGLASTLARDVPFSALYWGAVEPIRSSLLAAVPRGGEWTVAADGPHTTMVAPGPAAGQVVAANIVAGGVAGAVAAAATTPLDVVKTQVQLAGGQHVRIAQALRGLVKRGGLFAGVGARAARTAPACAIVLSAYELIKFAGQRV